MFIFAHDRSCRVLLQQHQLLHKYGTGRFSVMSQAERNRVVEAADIMANSLPAVQVSLQKLDVGRLRDLVTGDLEQKIWKTRLKLSKERTAGNLGLT